MSGSVKVWVYHIVLLGFRGSGVEGSIEFTILFGFAFRIRGSCRCVLSFMAWCGWFPAANPGTPKS